jgi:hypothetical protein
LRGYNASFDCFTATTRRYQTVIVLNILCTSGHRFEGWFASSNAFREQCERQLVLCPHCQTAAVSLLPSAPHVRRSAADTPVEQGVAPVVPPALAAQLYQTLVLAAKQAENVGERFPEEARRIHYDEAPARSIRGVASADETLELLEEGILVLPAPVPHEDEFH